MATNKRKDAAALFELIDKSSLKVPKNAGALKIPSWWSSKTNPPVAGNASAVTAGTSVPVQAVPVTEEKGQAKLFEPPAAGVQSGQSPTIRPPGPGRNAVSAAAESAPKVVIPASAKPPEAAKNGFENGRKPFRPQTMEQGGAADRDYSRGPKFNFSRVPIWAMVVGASLVVVVICLIIFMLGHGKGAAGGGSGVVPAVTNGGGGGGLPVVGPVMGEGLGGVPVHPLLPPGPVINNGGGGTPVIGGGMVSGGNVTEQTVGQVYEPGTVKRSGDLFYIKIASSLAESVARQNAKFLAEHGVDVSVETQMVGGKLWYVIVSAKGYPSVTATVADRKKIVDIGHLTKDYGQHHKAWDDAYAVHLKPG